MEKVEKNQEWYLMCPNVSKGLSDVYGGDFNVLYESYEEQIAKLSYQETDSNRNKLTVEIIKDIIKGEDKRKILVLSDRRSHLDILYNLLEQDLSVSFTYGLFVGSMKIADLEKSKACDVILATYAAFKEGVSEKDLNTLILTTPKKFIGHLKNTIKKESGGMEQIVGRIFRKDHIDLEPIIIDFQDNFSVYKTQSAGRRNFYKQHFKNSILENQSINLDEHEDVKIEYVKNNKKIEKIEKDKELENNILSQLNTCCILE